MKQFKIFFILIFFNLFLFADVILKAPDSFIKGEPYYFEYEAYGNSVKFPDIEKIDGYLVEDLGTSRSLQIINGNYDEKISKKYKIVPRDSFTIPQFKFEINDQDVYTKAKDVVAKLVHKTTSENFDLTLKASKKELYVGEDLLVKLVFKYKRGLQITDLIFENPHFENFWSKRVDSSSKIYEQNGYKTQELDFLLFPQKSGELVINPLKVDVRMMDSSRNSNFSFFTTAAKSVKVYSNELKFDVKELPKEVTLIGDFDIKASVDKSKIKLGESISYKLDIKGTGNFDDIEDIKLDIANATIYDNKPEINTDYSEKGYSGTYSKAYSIVPNSSLEIPSIEFKYFSKEDKKVVIKKTAAFKIEVINQEAKKVVLEKPKEKVEVKKEVIVEKNASLEEKIMYFLLGVIFTLLIFGLISYVKLKKSKKVSEETPLNKLVKASKDRNTLMRILIPYLKKDESLDQLIYSCESNDKEFRQLKKEILERLKEIRV